VHGFWNWLVNEKEVRARKPALVCLADGSVVILRPGEKVQKNGSSRPMRRPYFGWSGKRSAAWQSAAHMDGEHCDWILLSWYVIVGVGVLIRLPGVARKGRADT
jgi:hypothetical protein